MILVVLFVIAITKEKNEAYLAAKIRRKKGDKNEMLELAKQFIGKECMIYMFSGTDLGPVGSGFRQRADDTDR